MIDRLSGDFNRGYTKAIQDLAEVLEYIQSDLKHHKKQFNANRIKQLMRCCLINRENLRENKNGFIRFNGQLDDFEWFVNERK